MRKACSQAQPEKAPDKPLRHLRDQSKVAQRQLIDILSGSEKGVFWKRGLFRKVHSLEIPEILENPQTLEDKGESDHFLEILEI